MHAILMSYNTKMYYVMVIVMEGLVAFPYQDDIKMEGLASFGFKMTHVNLTLE